MSYIDPSLLQPQFQQPQVPPNFQDAIRIGMTPEEYQAQYLDQTAPSYRDQFVQKQLGYASADPFQVAGQYGLVQNNGKYGPDDMRSLISNQFTVGNQALGAMESNARMDLAQAEGGRQAQQFAAEFGDPGQAFDMLVQLGHDPAVMAQTLQSGDVDAIRGMFTAWAQDLGELDDNGQPTFQTPRARNLFSGIEQHINDYAQSQQAEADQGMQQSRQQRFKSLTPEMRQREVYLNMNKPEGDRLGNRVIMPDGRVLYGENAELLASRVGEVNKMGNPNRWAYNNQSGYQRYPTIPRSQPTTSTRTSTALAKEAGVTAPGEKPWKPASDPRWQEGPVDRNAPVWKPPANPNNANVRWDEKKHQWVEI